MRSEAFLREIRTQPALQRAVLKKITVEGRRVTFHLVTDTAYAAEDVAFAESVCKKYAPEGCEAYAELMKSVPSAEGVRAAITEYVGAKFPASAAFLSPADVEVVTDRTGGRFFLTAGETAYAQLAKDQILDSLSAALMRQFCGSWVGDIRLTDRAESAEIERDIPPAEYVRAPRTFGITRYEGIDGASPERALYIADLAGEAPSVTVCGRLTYIEERQTKTGKPYFRMTVTDGTGQLAASYFSKQKTVEKVRALKAGDSVCLTGVNELFNGAFRFTARQVDYGAPPEGFTPERRPSRPVPASYVAVRPEPASDLVQADVFGGKPLPEALTAGSFVVFDLETTGLNSSPVGGVMDRIIEIGAVRIEGGQIREKFSSFVACPVKLSAEIVKITGIEDDMLVGAPEIGAVIADFFKFAEGCVLVGHNVGFDCGFIRYYGEQEGYLFDQKQYDTIAFAQELLRLPNYKLDTVASHFGFEFHHHRAFDDAFVTAKIFLALAREKGGLPS